jgi:S-(hydroxymethyl)glutathione dehydrogenase/alcohol dehydrogenase
MSISTRAAVLVETGKPLQILDVTLLPPKATEVVVQMGASGVCHTDLILQHSAYAPKPMVLGHEGAGTIVEVGREVTGVKVGDKVALNWSPACGACYCCVRGQTFLCEEVENAIVKGTMRDGTNRIEYRGEPGYHASLLSTHAEFAVVDQASCVRLPGDMPFAQAALLGCGVPTGYGAVVHAGGVEEGATVAVFGCGGIGVNSIQGAKLVGASRIVACDIKQSNLDLALRFGATDVVNVAKTDPVEVVRELTAGRGVDYAIDTTGAPRATSQAWDCTRAGGTVVVLGRYTDSQMSLDARLFHRKGKTIKGSLYGDIVPERDIRRLAELYLDGKILLDELVLGRIALEDVNLALEMFDDPSKPNVGHNVIMFG